MTARVQHQREAKLEKNPECEQPKAAAADALLHF